ncbi:hypothetical protein F53441_11312 [Fusarium austroafricanum]|uniref:RWD domain-containing protein n=1 Tax=Fusarium austroafricanum TaxID=2364996 RepID=A0A8H4NSR4_9HYPO|nr:hypothetical protein F53441_11312 [Fusarium austroafricanum]
MSEELQDEVEAINSIYGNGSLISAEYDSTIFILKLPGDASSLRIKFPSDYPSRPPNVLGTHHSSGGVKGAGARDLALFRDALSEVFQEGLVCLFDAVEEFTRRTEEQKPEPEDEPQASTTAEVQYYEEPDFPPPEWIQSELVTESKSTFLAHVARVTSPDQARYYVQLLLASDKRIRSATHNMTAWRIRGPGAASFQDCDDDGEAAAGGRMLHLMQVMDIWDAMVVVTRWYGGVQLGPRRFALINAVARDGFVTAGLVKEEKQEKKKGK